MPYLEAYISSMAIKGRQLTPDDAERDLYSAILKQNHLEMNNILSRGADPNFISPSGDRLIHTLILQFKRQNTGYQNLFNCSRVLINAGASPMTNSIVLGQPWAECITELKEFKTIAPPLYYLVSSQCKWDHITLKRKNLALLWAESMDNGNIKNMLLEISNMIDERKQNEKND